MLRGLFAKLRRRGIDFNSRPSRQATGDTSYDGMLDQVCLQLSKDLKIGQSKLYPEDRLREDLGYRFDWLGLRDEIEDLVDVLFSGDASVTALLFKCRTIDDVVRLRMERHQK